MSEQQTQQTQEQIIAQPTESTNEPEQTEKQDAPINQQQQQIPMTQMGMYGGYPYQQYQQQYPMQQLYYPQQQQQQQIPMGQMGMYGGYPYQQYQQYLMQQMYYPQQQQQQQNQMNQLTSQMKKMQVQPKKVVTLEVHKEKVFKEEELIQQINSKEQKYQREANFFMLKSYNEENIVKAITNSVWSSTKEMNKKLNALFEKNAEKKIPIYLFFSINSRGSIEGCAKMVSPVNFDGVFEGWSQQGKWFGIFDLDWVFIKEVPNREFKHITNKLNEGKPVYICKNGQDIPVEQGNAMLKVFTAYQHQTSLLEKVKDYQK